MGVLKILCRSLGQGTLFCGFFIQKMQHAMQLLRQGMLRHRETLLLCDDDSTPFHTFNCW